MKRLDEEAGQSLLLPLRLLHCKAAQESACKPSSFSRCVPIGPVPPSNGNEWLSDDSTGRGSHPGAAGHRAEDHHPRHRDDHHRRCRISGRDRHARRPGMSGFPLLVPTSAEVGSAAGTRTERLRADSCPHSARPPRGERSITAVPVCHRSRRSWQRRTACTTPRSCRSASPSWPAASPSSRWATRP